MRNQHHGGGQHGWARGGGGMGRGGICRCGRYLGRGGVVPIQPSATVEDQATFLRTMASELETQLTWIRGELARLAPTEA